MVVHHMEVSGGLERIVYKLLELTNVREASAFPRDCTRLIP